MTARHGAEELSVVRHAMPYVTYHWNYEVGYQGPGESSVLKGAVTLTPVGGRVTAGAGAGAASGDGTRKAAAGWCG